MHPPFLVEGKPWPLDALSLPAVCLSPQIVDGSTKGKVTGSKVTGTAELGTVSIQGAPARGEAGGRGQAALCGSPWPLSTRPCAQVANGLEAQNCRSELHTFPASSGGPEDAQSAAFSAERARSPSALAPGECLPGPGTGAGGPEPQWCATMGQEPAPREQLVYLSHPPAPHHRPNTSPER